MTYRHITKPHVQALKQEVALNPHVQALNTEVALDHADTQTVNTAKHARALQHEMAPGKPTNNTEHRAKGIPTDNLNKDGTTGTRSRQAHPQPSTQKEGTSGIG